MDLLLDLGTGLGKAAWKTGSFQCCRFPPFMCSIYVQGKGKMQSNLVLVVPHWLLE